MNPYSCINLTGTFADWFLVHRQGKLEYGQVIEMDFDSEVKRVKFHFWKLSEDHDEWIELGSPRIAPNVSESNANGYMVRISFFTNRILLCLLMYGDR